MPRLSAASLHRVSFTLNGRMPFPDKPSRACC